MQKKAVVYNFPYFLDSSSTFAAFATNEWAIFLDSGRPRSTQGRYDILSGNPVCTLITQGENTTITTKNEIIISNENPFDLLRQFARFRARVLA